MTYSWTRVRACCLLCWDHWEDFHGFVILWLFAAAEKPFSDNFSCCAEFRLTGRIRHKIKWIHDVISLLNNSKSLFMHHSITGPEADEISVSSTNLTNLVQCWCRKTHKLWIRSKRWLWNVLHYIRGIWQGACTHEHRWYYDITTLVSVTD